MRFKKKVALILCGLFLVGVVSGGFLYLQDNATSSGSGVSSTIDTKYDYVVDHSISMVKDIYPGARNGDINKIGSICYSYSEVILTGILDQSIHWSLTELVNPSTGLPYTFTIDVPSKISFVATPVGVPFNVYLCWYPEGTDPEEEPEPVIYYVGSGSEITLDAYPDGYQGEDVWIAISSDDTIVYFSKMVVEMVPYIFTSGVTQVVAKSKNLIDYTGATLYGGDKCEIVQDGVVMPEGSKYYISIPLSLPECEAFTVSFSGINDNGENPNRYCFQYSDGSYSSQAYSGDWIFTDLPVKALIIYKQDANVPLTADLIISNIQVEAGFEATEYTPWFPDRVLIDSPPEVRALPGYGVGDFYNYNYINLQNGTYVQVCKIEGTDVVLLDKVKTFDISQYLPVGSGVVDLFGVSQLVFVNEYDLDVPSSLSYRCLVS